MLRSRCTACAMAPSRGNAPLRCQCRWRANAAYDTARADPTPSALADQADQRSLRRRWLAAPDPLGRRVELSSLDLLGATGPGDREKLLFHDARAERSSSDDDGVISLDIVDSTAVNASVWLTARGIASRAPISVMVSSPAFAQFGRHGTRYRWDALFIELSDPSACDVSLDLPVWRPFRPTCHRSLPALSTLTVHCSTPVCRGRDAADIDPAASTKRRPIAALLGARTISTLVHLRRTTRPRGSNLNASQTERTQTCLELDAPPICGETQARAEVVASALG
jgi:hypothetical protein